MKILIHDYAGHPFQAELSRELARRGYAVIHAWFGQDTGPKGRLAILPDDPAELSFHAIGSEIEYSKTNFLKRRRGDTIYGKELANLVHSTAPDIVISGNTPTEAQESLVEACQNMDIPFVYWCQDFYSIAASRILKAKYSLLGSLVGGYYQYLERRQMMRAGKIIHITESFCNQTDLWNIPRAKVAVIPNWGALNEIDEYPRDNEWAQRNHLKPGFRCIYNGTLALKHNPELLIELARSLEDEDELILVAAGVGAGAVENAVKREGLSNVRILPLQPMEQLSQVLGSADVLLAVIEREAGEYSVPSKVLSYLCAGKPIVLAAPPSNLATAIVSMNGCGLAVDPQNIQGFVKACLSYKGNVMQRKKAGENSRAYAEGNFDIVRVSQKFVEIIEELAVPQPAHVMSRLG